MDKLVTLSGASTLYKSARDEIKKVSTNLSNVDESKVGYATVEDGYLILKANEDSEEIIAKLTGFGGGGGGGGSVTNLTLKTIGENRWVIKDIPEGQPAVQYFTWSSTLDGQSTEDGILEIKIDNETVKKVAIEQGDFTEDFSNYVQKGSHTIQVIVTDAYDNYARLRFTLNYLEYRIMSSFDSSNPQEGDFVFRYTPVGPGEKTFHFLMDGKEFDTFTSESEREMEYLVQTSNPNYPEGFQWHGAHTFEAYFTIVLENVKDPIPSNILSYELICVDTTLPDAPPIITSNFDLTTTTQYSNVTIPYYVYTPGTSKSVVELYINGELQTVLDNVPRVQQTWSNRLTEVRVYEMKIKSGSSEKIFNINVTKISADVSVVAGADLDLSAEGKSNADTSGRSHWSSYSTFFGKDINAEFINFNWITDGWISDSTTDNITVLRVKDNAKVIIPYTPFDKALKNERINNGQTFEFEFKTTNIFDYDTEIVKCYNGARKLGFRITAQEVHFVGSINSVYSQYKKDEKVRVTFTITPVGENNFICCYVNGILSKVAAFTASEEFTQDPASFIELGSPDAILDLYRIRIYNKALSRFDVVNNWIADMYSSEDIVKYYNENNIYANNQFDISFEAVKAKLTSLPYIVVDIDSTTSTDGKVEVHSLPTRKGNKVLCDGYYVDPVNEYNSFSWKRGELDVQGTSSQAYPIKNFKLKIKKAKTYKTDKWDQKKDCSGFIMTKASEEAEDEVIFSKYSMRGYSDYTQFEKGDPSKGYKGPLSIPTNTFVFKADFASSEGTNNVELVRFYNDLAESQDILTPPQDPNKGGDKRVRIGIDGFPMVWFGKEGKNINFIGKYNFNNHKGTDEVYGFDMHGEVIEEVKNSAGKTIGYERTVDGVPDESWEMCDNNTELTLWQRKPGESNKTILIQVVSGEEKEVQYTDFVVDGTSEYDRVKNEVLSPMKEGTYPRSKMTQEQSDLYDEYIPLWSRYADLDSWINALKVTEIYNDGSSLNESIKEQRNFVIGFLKKDIVSMFNLIERLVEITPVEDLLGVGGKGEEVAHAFEVRYPGEWYDSWTEFAIPLAKTERFTNLIGWVASTNPEKATNRPLSELESANYASSVTYDKKYTEDTAEYRMAKFKYEFRNFFDMDATLLYYIFTEMFLMIDSRAKNSFPTYFAITKAKAIYKLTKDTVVVADKVYYRLVEGVYEPAELEHGYPITEELYEKIDTEEEETEEITWADGRVTQWPKGRWIWFPYDMDTAIGINNEGLLVFDYSLEDTEALLGNDVVKLGTPNSVPVYNGSSSVLWSNFRKSFPNEILVEYQKFRNAGYFSYDSIESMYENHQKLWPAAIFNEDAYYKYIKPYSETGAPYLGMCLGSKEHQRKWWLYNRFRFLDSKYETGDAAGEEHQITFRANGVAGDRTIWITPYTDIYVKVQGSEGWASTPVKTYAGDTAKVVITATQFGDTEFWINSAQEIKSIEKLNESLMISTFNISKAYNLQYLDVSVPMKIESMEYNYGGVLQDKTRYYKKVGDTYQFVMETGKGIADQNIPAKDPDTDEWYYFKTANVTLQGLKFGNNVLMRYVNASNCLMLGDPDGKFREPVVDLSKCEQLERCYFNRTRLTEVKLPGGGRLTEVVLPSSITTLNIENQQKITKFEIVDDDDNWDTSNISSLTIRNVSKAIEDIAIDIINGITTGAGHATSLVFEGFNITADDMTEFDRFINKILSFTNASMSGVISVATSDPELTDYEWMTYERYADIMSHFPESLDLILRCVVRKEARFINYDGSELFYTYDDVFARDSYDVVYGGSTPRKPSDEDNRYDFDGWSLVPGGNVVYEPGDEITTDKSITLYAHYEVTPRYKVRFYSYDSVADVSEPIYETTIDAKEQDYADFVGDFPVAPSSPEFSNVDFIGWGTNTYAGIDIADDLNHRRILNVTSDMDVFAQMDWEIVDNTIVLENPPTYVNYYPDDVFNKSGIVISVEKHIPTGSIRVPVVFTYNTEPFTEEDRSIDLIVNENNKITIEIGMSVSMRVSKDPDAGYQTADTAPDLTGLEFEVTFSNGQTETITSDYSYTPEDFTSSSYMPSESIGSWSMNVEFSYVNLSCTYDIYVLLGSISDLDSCDWKLISRICNAGQASKTWSIGDMKKVYVTGANTSDHYSIAGDYKFRILSFDHNIRYSERPDGTIFDRGDDHIYDYPTGQHTITFGLAEGKLSQAQSGPFYPMGAYLATNIMPDNPYEDAEHWRYAWDGTPGGGCIGQTLTHNFILSFPQDLQDVIKEVTKSQAGFDYQERIVYKRQPEEQEYPDNKRGANAIVSQQEKLFIPSMYEMYGVNRDKDTKYLNVDESDGCARFDYYSMYDAPEYRIVSTQWGGSYYPLPVYLRTFLYQWVDSSKYQRNYYVTSTSKGYLDDVSGDTLTTGSVNKLYIICFNV